MDGLKRRGRSKADSTGLLITGKESSMWDAWRGHILQDKGPKHVNELGKQVSIIYYWVFKAPPLQEERNG